MILIFALIGQWQFTQSNPNYLAGTISFGIGLILLLSISHGWSPAALVPLPDSPIFQHLEPITKRGEIRLFLIVSVVILSGFAFAGFAGNSLMGGLWPWLGAILLFLAAFAEEPNFEQESARKNLHNWWRHTDKRVLVILSVIMLLAIFFRIYLLQDIPAEMTSDHAEKLLDVQDILDGQRPIFFPRNTGREAVQFYLTAFLVRFTPLGMNHLALKVGTAIIGIMALPFAYLIGREFYGNLAGLITAFLMAVSHWHVAITRVGLRFPFTAAFATPALYFLFRAFKANRRNDWLAAAGFLGIGLHTYTAMRIVPLLFIMLIGLRLTMDGWNRWRKRPLPSFNSWSSGFVRNGLIGGFFTILLFLPLARVIIDDPEAFWLRMASRTQAVNQPSVLQQLGVLLGNTKNALLMFNIKGDVVIVNTIPGSPVLGLVTAALFILGVFYLLWRLLPHRDRRSLFILVTLFTFLVPSILSLAYPQENPSVVRTGGAIPWVMLVAALPLTIIVMRLQSLPTYVGKAAAVVVFAVLAVGVVRYNYDWYFKRYNALIRHSLWNSSEMGAVMRDFVQTGGDPANVTHVPFPHWVDTRNIGINAGYVRWDNVATDQTWQGGQTHSTKPKLFLVFPDDTKSLKRLQTLYPRGETEVFDSEREGKDFIIYRVSE